MSDDQAPQAPQSVTTPGSLLKAAREALSKTQSDIAQKVCLSRQVIIDIENDHYEHISAAVYVRGYLKAYARAVGLAETDIIAAFDACGFEIDRPQRPNPMTIPEMAVHRGRPRRSRNPVRWVSMGVFLLMIVLVVLWWNSQKSTLNTTQNQNLLSSSQPSISSVVQKPIATMDAAPVQKKSIPAVKPVTKRVAKALPTPVVTPAKNTQLKPNYIITPVTNH